MCRLRLVLAGAGLVLGFLGLLGMAGGSLPTGAILFEPVENMLYLFLGALCLLSTRGTFPPRGTRSQGDGQAIPLSRVRLSRPDRPGNPVHQRPSTQEELARVPEPGAPLAGPRGVIYTPEGRATPPGPPLTETGDLYTPGVIPPKAVGRPVPADVNVTDRMLLTAETDLANWLTYYGDYSGRYYVPDTQINPTNVHRLIPRWIFQTGILGGFECTPLVVNGIMYVTTSDGPEVIALDAKTGDLLWRYFYPRPVGIGLCCGPVNRGVALGRGRLYFATLDTRLIALDSRTGDYLWHAQSGDPRKGESQTQAPLYYKGRVLVGLSGGEYNAKGRMHCYDAATGRLLWVFQTVADFGWGAGDPALYGGACPWMTGVIDPATDTLFFGTGNPAPDFYGGDRPGPNPYSCSIVALDIRTGALKWHYQITPHDLWDYDSAAPLFLYTALIGGRPVQAVGHADKNGFFYALDRATGQLLFRSEPFVRQQNFGVPPTPEGLVFCPGISGGTEWPPAAHQPELGLTYIAAVHSCAIITSHPWEPVPGRGFWGSTFAQLVGEAYGSVVAMDVNTGRIRWEHRTPLPLIGGTLSTGSVRAGGSLVFTGEQDGYVNALNAETGEVLWRYQCGAGHHAPPISYRIGGEQFIAVCVGNGGAIKAIGIREIGDERIPGGRFGDTVIAFGLPGGGSRWKP